MPLRWFLELVHVAEGDRVYSHAIGERIWISEGARVAMGRTPSGEVHCLGRGQGGRRALSVEEHDDTLRLNHTGHNLPVWHSGRPVHGNVELAVGDHVGPCYGISFLVGRADPGPLPGAARVGPAIAFAPRSNSSAPRVSSGFRIDDPTRALVDVLWWHEEIAAEALQRTRARTQPAHPSCARVLDVGVVPAGTWALRESTLGVSLPKLWERTRAQRAALDVDTAGFIVESLGRGVLVGVLDWGLSTAGAVLRFADGQPLLLEQPLDEHLLPRLDEEDAPSLALECAALLARCLQPGRSFDRQLVWTPPAQVRADVRAALADMTELADDVRVLALAAAAEDPGARPTAPDLLDAISRARSVSSSMAVQAHVREVLAQLFPAERAAVDDMLEAAGVLDLASL